MYGDLSFSVAKFVDSVWDVGFGRGGQAIMIWVTYEVVMQSLNWIMESRPVPYSLFVGATLSPIDLTTIGPLSHLLRAKFTMQHECLAAWLILSIVWVIAFPTIAGAMTGYINRVDPRDDTLVVLHQSGLYMNITDFFNPAYNAYRYANNCESFVSNIPPSGFGINYETIVTQNSSDPTLWNFLGGSSRFTSSFLVESPQLILDHTNVSLPPGAGACFQSFRYINNEIYAENYTDSLDNVQCLQGLGYQWGFSSTLIIVFLICNTIWLTGTFVTLESLSRQSEFVKKGRRMGRYRAVVDLAEAIGTELGSSLSAYSDQDLEKALKGRDPVRYHVRQYLRGGRRFMHVGLSPDHPNGEKVVLEFDRKYA